MPSSSGQLGGRADAISSGRAARNKESMQGTLGPGAVNRMATAKRLPSHPREIQGSVKQCCSSLGFFPESPQLMVLPAVGCQSASQLGSLDNVKGT